MHNIITADNWVGHTLGYLGTVAEQSGEGMAVVDLSGTLQFANAAWARMHGYKTRHELVGKQISLFHTEEQMETDVIPFIEETKHRGRLMGPVEHVRKDGTPFPAEMEMTIVKDERGKNIGLIVFATDITERRQAEEELKQYCDELERRVEELSAELTATKEQLQHEMTKRKLSEEELLEGIIEAEEPKEKIVPFNPQELKALSELAKRLA